MTELETLVAAVTEAHNAVCKAECDADDGARHGVDYGQSELPELRARFSESLAALAAYASKRDDTVRQAIVLLSQNGDTYDRAKQADGALVILEAIQ